MSRAMYRLPVLLLAFAVAWPALAGEGRIPIWDEAGAGTPNNPIVADGKYIVTRDILAGLGPPAIDISAPNVDLDLNGFNLANFAGGPVIDITGPVETIRIHNGTLFAGAPGILRVAGAPAPTLKIIIEDVKMHDLGGPGIDISEVETIVIRRSAIRATSGPGILLPGPPFTNGEISYNSIKETFGDGIFVDSAAGMEISHNHLEIPGAGGTGSGIVVVGSVGNLIGENVMSDPGGDGIFLRGSSGNKIYNNVVRHAFASCYHLDPSASDNLILDNIGTDCGFDFPPGHGLWVESERNHIEGNTLNANEACGLYFSTLAFGNVFGRNMARGNDADFSFCFPASAGCVGLLFPPDSCDATGGGNDTNLENMIPGPPPF